MAKYEYLPGGFTYLNTEASSYCTSFRVKELKNEEAARDWIQKHQDISKVTWRLAKTYPNCGKINLFKLILRCQHSPGKPIKGRRISKQTNCQATLSITVKRISEKSSEIDRKYPGIVVFKSTHNHALDSAESLKMREMSTKTKQKLQTLFLQGHSAASALQQLKSDLREEHGERYAQISLDGSFLPTYSVVHKLFQKELSVNSCSLSDKEVLRHLDKIVNDFTRSGGMAKANKTADGYHPYLMLCTPIMIRILNHLPETVDSLWVHCSGTYKEQKHWVYFLVTSTLAGDLPAAVIITTTKKMSVFQEALKALKEFIPRKSILAQSDPKVFLSHSLAFLTEDLQQEFPESVLLWSQHHFMKSVWSWLCDPDHEIDESDRQELYYHVKDIMLAESTERAVERREVMLSTSTAQRYDAFLEYFENLWINGEHWATFARGGILEGDGEKVNCIEVVSRVANESVLNRVVTFNLSRLVHYIITKFETYLRKRLTSFCRGKYPKAALKSMLPKERGARHEVQEIDAASGLYLVLDLKHNSRHVLDVMTGICQCEVGQKEMLCAHATSVALHLASQINMDPLVPDEKTKVRLLFVASGVTWKQKMLDKLKASGDIPIKRSLSDCEEEEEEESEELSAANFVEASYTSPAPKRKIGGRCLSADVQAKWKGFVQRIDKGIRDSPDLYVLAMEKFVQNVEKYASTDSELVVALCNFGQ